MSAILAFSRMASPGVRRLEAGFGRMRSWVSDRAEDFNSDQRGDVAVIFGLMTIVMMLMIGGAVDFGRWLHARRQTISAMDAAVLAGGRALQVNSKDTNAAIASAKKFYLENTKSRIATKNDTIGFAPADGNTAFTANGNVFIETPILALANIKQLPLLNANKSEYSKAQLAVGGDAEMNLEISLMLDTSGSMGGNKIKDLKDAAEDLINIVVWEDQSEYTSKVALAPFSADMRIPASMLDAVRGANLPNEFEVSCGGNCKKKYKLTPCIAERPGDNKYTDVVPGPGNYMLPVYGTNASCSQQAANTVTPLTNSKSALHAAVQGMPLGGGTAGHLGTAWAWYLLSPNFAPVLPAASAPASYTAPKLQKIAILMTDGEYNTQYNAIGLSASANQSVNGSSANQAKALCDGMKAKGITVYTVGFALGNNATAMNTLEYCATSAGHVYSPEDGEELRQAFRDIALKISTLYVSN